MEKEYKTINTYDFYCPFCVAITTWDNKGGLSKC